MYIDTHAHFDNLDTAQADIQAAREADVDIIAVGGNPTLNTNALTLATQYPAHLAAANGFDWSNADTLVPDDALTALKPVLPKLCAVGELGLDLHYVQGPAVERTQVALFQSQAELAYTHHLPFILHTRECDALTLSALDDLPQPTDGRRGVAHSFTGDIPFARQLLDRGLYISFSGIVTFRNADLLRQTAKYIPDDRILIETDSPYLAPVPKRGSTNQPAFVRHTAETVAALRGTPLLAFAALTTQNAQTLFHFPDAAQPADALRQPQPNETLAHD